VVAVLHWYNGSLRIAEQAITSGLWYSINPAMTSSVRAAKLLQALPPQHILLETDGPFARSGAGPARPSDLPVVVTQLADV
jgi:TatD DNase family protein